MIRIVCGIGCICENEMLREMIKSIHMVIKQAAQASVAYIYNTCVSTDASRVGGVGATKRDESWSRWWDERKLALPGP